ncbi:hypothetical protein V5799_030425 [Amblyomma americanum]|uniref:ABC transporter domain-containing protein n=1 Tax=Amblyomma americanum TaxID=6943 RepID=A0AAQ4ENJ6_AMBAM
MLLLLNFTDRSLTSSQEYQRLMGLTDGAFWAGHFACGFSFCLVHSAVCVYFGTLTRQPVTGVAFLDSTDASLLYAVMLVHSALQMLTAMLIACACPSVWPALLCAVFVCLLLPSLAFLSLTGYGSLAEFVFQDRAVILLSSLLPSMATYNVLTILGIQNDFDGSAGWKNIADLALGVYAVTIADIWMVNFLTVVAMLVLIFYLSNVLPWNSPIPLHPLYFLRPSYWQANPTVRVPPYIPLDYSDKRFEPAPWLLRPVVHIEDVTMVYRSTHALRRVSLQAYEQEATAVVGRNGAGKTTLMNIVAGLVKPTVGSVFVRGYDMVKYTRLARGSVSYCPQRDLLFPDMTVWEHLLFFGAVPLVPSQLLIVDEPTSGLDPNSARSIWDLLLGVRISSTLLFSTHDMAEADVLADRVIALSSGTIVCNASPLYLKSTYGACILRRPCPPVMLLPITSSLKSGLRMHSFPIVVNPLNPSQSLTCSAPISLIMDSISLSQGTTVFGQQWPSDLATVVAGAGKGPTTWAQVQVLSMERFLFARRKGLLVAFAFIAPTLIVLVALRWMANGAAELSADFSHDARSGIVVPVSLSAHYPSAVTFLDDDASSRRTLTPFYQTLVRLRAKWIMAFT